MSDGGWTVERDHYEDGTLMYEDHYINGERVKTQEENR